MGAVPASNTGPTTAGEGKNLIFPLFYLLKVSPSLQPPTVGTHWGQGQPLVPENGAGIVSLQGEGQGTLEQSLPCPESEGTAPCWLCPLLLCQMLAGKGKNKSPAAAGAWLRAGNVLARCGAQG